jgi:hypothetical protein
MWRAACLSGLVSAVIASTPAQAATITSFVSKEGRVIIVLDGQISPGDAEAVSSIIKTANEQQKLVSGIRLNSVGGNLLEGVKIADIVRYAKIATVVANGAQCASACFVVFAAGNEKYASFAAFVGVHGASDAGRETLESNAATVSMAKVVRELGVPPGIIGKMVITPPDQIVWLTPDELRSMGTTMTGKPAQLPSSSEITSQLPALRQPTAPTATPNKTVPTWKELVDAALRTSSAQNNGKPRFHRACQPELKICSTGVFLKKSDGTEIVIKATEDLTGKIVQREVCEFNAFGDVRVCTDWDSGAKRRDMKDVNGNWHGISDQ